jgi:hypothetical protein
MDGCAMGAAADEVELGGPAFLPHPVNRSETVRTALMVVVFIVRTALMVVVFTKPSAS